MSMAEGEQVAWISDTFGDEENELSGELKHDSRENASLDSGTNDRQEI
jgi:hypothetical protein